MEANARQGLQRLKVVSFESRRSKEMAELIRRYGGEPVSAPALREIAPADNHAALDLLPKLQSGNFDLLILMTGVGTRTLNEALLTRYSQEQIREALRKCRIVARGPKPVGVLKELNLEPSLTVPEPNTWRELVATLDSAMDVGGKRIALQEYGVANAELIEALQNRGASVVTIPVYRWALPQDPGPLKSAIQRLVDGEMDIALFTNGAQVEHLFKVAASEQSEDPLRTAFSGVVIGSIGPVCTDVLQQFGLKPDVQPIHPKMGSLIAELAQSAHEKLAAKKHP